MAQYYALDVESVPSLDYPTASQVLRMQATTYLVFMRSFVHYCYIAEMDLGCIDKYRRMRSTLEILNTKTPYLDVDTLLSSLRSK